MTNILNRSLPSLILKICLLFFLITIVSVGMGLFLKYNALAENIDGHLYSLINLSPRIKLYEILITPFNYNFLNLGDSRPTYFYFLVSGFLLYLLFFKRSLFGWAFLAVIIGSVLAYIVTAIDWHFVFRARPFDSWPSQVDPFGKFAWRSWSSYPSGHVRETTLYVAIITHFLPRLTIFGILFILFIGYSRVYTGAHYPFDVLAGIIIGYGVAVLALIITRDFRKIFMNRKEVVNVNSNKASTS